MSERGRTLYTAIVAAAITSALTTYGLRALEGPPAAETPATDVDENTIVPDLMGLERETAQELATNRNLRFVVSAEEPSADHPAGHVSVQEPLAGSEVPGDSAVRVTISTGAPQSRVPEVLGLPVPLARTQIEAAGLAVGEISETGEGDPGTVAGLTPPAGAEVPAGATVALITVPAGLVIPDAVGDNYRGVRDQLQEMGLEVTIRRRFNPDRRDFVILALDPEPGTTVAPGSTVRMTINE